MLLFEEICKFMSYFFVNCSFLYSIALGNLIHSIKRQTILLSNCSVTLS